MTRQSFKKWLARVRQGRAGMTGLFWLSAGETTVLPMPVEIVLLPMMQYARAHVWRMATSVTLGAIAGAVLGYLFVFFFMQAMGDDLIAWAGWQEHQARFDALFARYGFLAIVLVGLLPPVPFQLAILSAGATGYPFLLFLLATAMARGGRYFGLGGLVWLFGDRVADAYQNHRLATILAATFVFAGVWGLVVLIERAFD